MKKSLLLAFLFSLGVSRLLAGWITPPPATATVGTTVSVTANGYVSAPSPYGPPGFLVLWTQSTANGPWSLTVLGTSYNGYVTGSTSKTLTAGQWTWDVRSITTSPSGTAPSGTQVVLATTNVGGFVSTTFTFGNLSFTADGNVKTATVTASPANATFNADLTKGPAVGTYTVSAMATGNFSGSGSSTLTISNPGNHAPTVQWNLSVYRPFPVLNVNGWFQAAQAIASDQDNNISQVQVDYLADVATNSWAAFAYNGVTAGNYSQIISDNNYADNGSTSLAKAHLFRARAFDSAGAVSEYVYLLVKPLGTSFSFADLPVYSDLNNRYFPNGGTHKINSVILGQVIDSLAGTTVRTLWFKNGVYDVDSSWARHAIVNNDFEWNQAMASEDEAAKLEYNSADGKYWRNPGTLGHFDNCSNVTFKSEVPMGAVLQWASYSILGDTKPSSAGQLCTLNSTMNSHQDWYTRARLPNSSAIYSTSEPRPWPLPGPCIVINSNSHNITFDGLNFRANYMVDPFHGGNDARRADNGNHLAIYGNGSSSGHAVKKCNFVNAPGWSVVSYNTDSVHFEDNVFNQTSGDGLNIQDSSNTWIERNNFREVGDDSIVITGNNHHVLSNSVWYGGWRGILAARTAYSEIRGNAIEGTASFSISLSPAESGMGNCDNIIISNNNIKTIAVPLIEAHHNAGETYSGRTGIEKGSVTAPHIYTAPSTINPCNVFNSVTPITTYTDGSSIPPP